MATTIEQGFELRGPITPVRELIRSVWRSRELIHVMARRDFYTRYRRPTLGVMWALAIPLVQAAVMSIVFSIVVRIHTDIPYPVFVMSGIVPWSFFQSTLATGVRAITSGAGIASKVYFPRMCLPLANVGTAFYTFFPTLVILIGTALVFGERPTWYWLFFIPGTLLMVLLTSAFVVVLAGLQVYFRDIAYIISAALTAWFYASAVFFPISLIHIKILRLAILFNPATGMVDMFRIPFHGLLPYSKYAIASTVFWIVVLYACAALLYRKYDRVFVDRL